jgi:hypothetical protein
VANLTEAENANWPKTSHGNDGVWKAWKAIKPGFPPFPHPLEIPAGFPHYHGYGDDYHISEDRQSPPKTRNQSHSHRKGLVNHVPGLKRKGCPGTLTPLRSTCCCICDGGAFFLARVVVAALRVGVAGRNEIVKKLSCEDGTMTRRLSLTFSGVEIEGSVDALIRRDEALRSVWLRQGRL